MKKILVTILAATAMGVSIPAMADGVGESSADVLVWYLDTEYAKEGKGTTFDTIKFWAVDSDNNKLGLGGLTYDDPSSLMADRYADLNGRSVNKQGQPTTSSKSSISTGYLADSSTDNYYTDLSTLKFDNGYSFLMELYKNGNDKAVAWMDFPISSSLSGIQEALHRLSELDSSFAQTEGFAYNMGEQMVPEPTSGLLLLVGGALLALRRRRR